jgi:hypothetical protein
MWNDGGTMTVTENMLFQGRRMRVCSWNASPGFISAASAALEHQLRQLVQVEMVTLKSLSHSAGVCDLLIISAEGLEDEAFPAWLKSISGRIPNTHGIPVPSIIFGDVPAPIQRELLRWAVEGNWYFDIVDPSHVTSLPVRVANFLRLHDHLHEVRRISDASRLLEARVREVESQLAGIVKGSPPK